MNMRIAKEEMAIMLPSTLSNYSPASLYEPAADPAPRTLLQRLGGVVRWVVEMPKRRAMLDELATLSDHELSDIGLSRADLSRVFEPTFVAQRNEDRSRPAGRPYAI